MPSRIATRGVSALAVGVALSALTIGGGLTSTGSALTSTGSTQTAAVVSSSLIPDRLDARGELTLSIDDTRGATRVPSPLRRLVVMLPAGLGLEIPTLRSCSASRLRARGAGGCPAASEIGRGRARVEAVAGSQLITEDIDLWVFLGPLRGLQPTFEVLGQGYTPLLKRIVLTGAVLPGSAPYGEELAMSIPPIATVPLEPDVSLATLTLTVGPGAHRLSRHANTILVPQRCPAGGFPFAAELTYADGSSADALATDPCPQQRK
jgi:hypothetical protein